MFLNWETRSWKPASPFAALARMRMINSKANMVNEMIWSAGFLLVMLLLVASVAECVVSSEEPVTSSEPMALSSYYQIPENRAHLAGKNKLTVLDLNFTELESMKYLA